MAWKVKKLGDVCDELFAGGDVPINNSSKFKTAKFSIPIYSNGAKNKGLYGYTNISRVIKPSITISARGTIGYSEIRDKEYLPVVRLIVLIPNKDLIDISFMHYAIISLNFANSGTSIPQLTVPMVKKYEIPVPPLPVQKQIVAILDEAFEKISKAKENAEKNLKNAKEVFESCLQSVFENKGEGWEEKTLGEITTKIGSGATPRGGNKSYKTEGISLIRSMNVHDRYFKERNLAFIDHKQAKDLSNVTLLENDVLLNITGASVTRCCIIPAKYLPARVNQHVSIIRPKPKIMDYDFLNLLLTSKYYKDQLLFTSEQGATRQAITKVQLQDFVIHYPPLTEQKRIVSKLDSLSSQTKSLEQIYTKKLADLEELKKSILQKAFKGELT